MIFHAEYGQGNRLMQQTEKQIKKFYPGVEAVVNYLLDLYEMTGLRIYFQSIQLWSRNNF
jgi:hypothetical protein